MCRVFATGRKNKAAYGRLASVLPYEAWGVQYTWCLVDYISASRWAYTWVGVHEWSTADIGMCEQQLVCYGGSLSPSL